MIKNRICAGLHNRIVRLVYILVAGLVAGICFNVAFSAPAWNIEGISGGLLSAALIYLFS